MAAKRDYYEVLGVSKNATEDEIKRAYRKKAKECHPDLHPDDKTAAERFKDLNEANEAEAIPSADLISEGWETSSTSCSTEEWAEEVPEARDRFRETIFAMSSGLPSRKPQRAAKRFSRFTEMNCATTAKAPARSPEHRLSPVQTVTGRGRSARAAAG